MDKKPSQCELILKHLQAGYTLTPLEALHRFNCLRLGGRINDLRKKHPEIETRMIEVDSGKHVAEYYIPVKKQTELFS